MSAPNGRFLRCIALCALLAVLGTSFVGCSFGRKTEPAQTAIEQMLLSTAADRAVDTALTKSIDEKKFEGLKGKVIFVDTSNLDAYIKPYVTAYIRAQLNQRGSLLTDDKGKAEIIIAPRSGALSIDGNVTMFGIPELPVPIPFVGTFKIPEIALWKKTDQAALAKIGIDAWEAASGKHVWTTNTQFGKAYYNRWTLLIIIKFRTTDLPER